jgi:hypothetical protein
MRDETRRAPGAPYGTVRLFLHDCPPHARVASFVGLLCGGVRHVMIRAAKLERRQALADIPRPGKS